MTQLAASLTTARYRTQAAIQGRLEGARSRRDTGAGVVEYVVIVAGMCLAAVALVALVTGVVNKYSQDIK